ncbi:helix-turn-helix transcriptional regulator [Sphingomonas sp. LB2R24]|uniref:helix-turn-helix domain-containing protein n=1 Tax=Sphingomonas sorbitolis TaxID=3096165 RepID=UPI002FC5F2BF
MDRAEYDSLTPMERNCLRLAHHERKTEHIAHELGIAASTVNTHIFAARRKLGGLSRLTAADQLRDYEAAAMVHDAPSTGRLDAAQAIDRMSEMDRARPSPPPPQPLSRPPLPMVEPEATGASPAVPTDVREERATFVFDDGALNSGRQDQRRDTPLQRVVTILAIALLVALVLIAAPAIYDSAAQRVANSLERPHAR